MNLLPGVADPMLSFKRPYLLFLLGLLVSVLSLQGCSPTTASLDEEDPSVAGKASSPAQEPVSAPQDPNPQAAAQPPAMADQEMAGKRFGLPANPQLMPKMDREEIEHILSQMAPDEHSKVLLRFNSFTLLLFYAIYHRYPTVEEGLDVLLNPPEPPDGRSREPFAQEILLVDGWGNPISYEPAQLEDGNPYFRIKSFGPDGIPSQDDLEVEADVLDVCREVSARIAAGELEKGEPAMGAPPVNAPPISASPENQ